MDTFGIWERYASDVEQEFRRAGFPDASYSVARGEGPRGSCTASWTWDVATALVNAHEWPSGLTLTWSSLGGWTYRVLDKHGQENTLVLPVPPLAAPSAVSAVLPALMDGRRGLLPSSQELWEHAGIVESSATSSLRFGDDKYDEAFQAAEEEAEAFLRWQQGPGGADVAEVSAVQEGGSSAAPQEGGK
ncbi:hypothetical protein [Streptomyces sp. NPDC058861]|uniref:hypothetical protein n=1 Tax=Streptomyces sp. NPDC058861 TaxID=3346653 RepID=UPI0036CE5820